MQKIRYGMFDAFAAFYNQNYDDRGGGYGGGYGGSRDFVLPTIPCAVTVCPCNKREKCEMPSAIKINAAGQCKMGVTAIEMEKRG